jgi:putative hydrolase of the HAD superfamily
MSGNVKPKAVLFDLYKTLVDIETDEHRPDVWERLARFLRYRRLPCDPGALYHGFFDMAKRSQEDSSEAHPEVDVLGIFRVLLRQLSYDGPEVFVAEVAQLFRALTMIHFGLYPDTIATLEALHGRFIVGLVSDAQRVFLEPELEMTGLPRLLDIMIVSSDHGFHKPDPRMFTLALGRLDIKPEEAVYVGDNLHRDIGGAQSASVRAILVNRGAKPVEAPMNCQPFKTFGTLTEVGAWLLN